MNVHPASATLIGVSAVGIGLDESGAIPGLDSCPPWLDHRLAANAKPVRENFAAWFSGSQVVDDQGFPLVVYHCGTFDENENPVLQVGKGGVHFGTEAAAQARDTGKRVDDFIADIKVESDLTESGRLAWFWSSEGIDSCDIDPEGYETETQARTAAERYGYNQEFYDTDPMPITAAFLSIRNPKRLKDHGVDWSGAVEQARREGHDGIVYRNEFEDSGSISYIVFHPDQVKSAVSNSGLYLLGNPSITDADAAHMLMRAHKARDAVSLVRRSQQILAAAV